MFSLINTSIIDNFEINDSGSYALGLIPVGKCEVAKTNMQVLCGSFNGINNFINFLIDEMPVAKRGMASEQNRDDFNGFKSYKECLNTFLHNPHLLDREKIIYDKIKVSTNAGNNISYDVTGDFLDIGKYLSDDPETFGSNIDGNPTNKRVRFIFNMSAASMVNVDIMKRKCLLFSQLVDWLESNGVRVEIIACESSQVGHLEIKVKNFSDRFIYNDILIASNPDFFRRLFFRFAEYSPSWEGGYGSSIALTDYIRIKLKKLPFEFNNNEHTIFWGNSDTNTNDLHEIESTALEVKKWLEENLPERVEFSKNDMKKVAVAPFTPRW